MREIDQSHPKAAEAPSNYNRFAAMAIRCAAIAVVQILLIAWLTGPGVLSPPYVVSESWHAFNYPWNVMPVALIADATLCLLITICNRRNARRVIVSVACSLSTLAITVVLLGPFINSAERRWSVGTEEVLLLVSSAAVAVLGWIIGGFVNEQMDGRQPSRLPRIQFTLSDLLMAMFVVSCVVAFVTFVVSLRNG